MWPFDNLPITLNNFFKTAPILSDFYKAGSSFAALERVKSNPSMPYYATQPYAAAGQTTVQQSKPVIQVKTVADTPHAAAQPVNPFMTVTFPVPRHSIPPPLIFTMPRLYIEPTGPMLVPLASKVIAPQSTIRVLPTTMPYQPLPPQLSGHDVTPSERRYHEIYSIANNPAVDIATRLKAIVVIQGVSDPWVSTIIRDNVSEYMRKVGRSYTQ